MTWLQERLDKIGYTHEDLRRILKQRGIERSRVAITGWTNGHPIPLLSNPKEANILAESLKWSLPELLEAAGYNLGMPVEFKPEINELLPLIKQYRDLPKLRRKLFIETLQHFAEFGANISEDDLTDALKDDE